MSNPTLCPAFKRLAKEKGLEFHRRGSNHNIFRFSSHPSITFPVSDKIGVHGHSSDIKALSKQLDRRLAQVA